MHRNLLFLRFASLINVEENTNVWGSQEILDLEFLTSPHKALGLYQRPLVFQHLFAAGLGAWIGIENLSH